ncbi:serpin family protein [Streptomyces bambusae]|uniref:serpin family protein n=1 Tax=Streptomyces bambusae TaxID=1550616 RepID=UPI001CFCB826|nr:serpin family protein [Streptomyces bambusae]MCB5169053.1 serpin family protein [Streptomyces bambusae]
MRDATVRAVNGLTAHWAGAAVTGEQGTVLTAAGVWPLLALLADGAGGPARGELAAAVGLPADGAATAAGDFLAGLGRVPGLVTATGLWTRHDLPLSEGWTGRLPAGTRGQLTGDADADRTTLDEWAVRQTGGLVDHMPVPLDTDPPMVLASALALRLKWIRPFHPVPQDFTEGPWAGQEALGLVRSTALLDRVRVAETATGPVTLLEVVGAGGVDVHLVLGEPHARPGEVLDGGIAAVTRAVPSVDGRALPEGTPGPGLHIGTRLSYDREPRLDVGTVAFSVTGTHDLLAHRRLFGLETATDSRFGHFPDISSHPLAVGSARQSAVARFDAEGFEASAVTAIGMAAGCGLPARVMYRTRHIRALFDRPFGFLAVHRTSRLVLAAGWVAEPLPCPEDDWGYDSDEEDDF